MRATNVSSIRHPGDGVREVVGRLVGGSERGRRGNRAALVNVRVLFGCAAEVGKDRRGGGGASSGDRGGLIFRYLFVPGDYGLGVHDSRYI